MLRRPSPLLPAALLAGLAVALACAPAWGQAVTRPAQAPMTGAAWAPIGAFAEARLLPYVVVGDGVPAPLTQQGGDPARGRAIVANRQLGLCLLCHAAPIPEERFQGDLAPDLAGAGARWSAAQLRLRMVDASRFNAYTIMPSYYRNDGLRRVAPAQQGKPLLDAQQIEDVVAWLQTLRQPSGSMP